MPTPSIQVLLTRLNALRRVYMYTRHIKFYIANKFLQKFDYNYNDIIDYDYYNIIDKYNTFVHRQCILEHRDQDKCMFTKLILHS